MFIHKDKPIHKHLLLNLLIMDSHYHIKAGFIPENRDELACRIEIITYPYWEWFKESK